MASIEINDLPVVYDLTEDEARWVGNDSAFGRGGAGSPVATTIADRQDEEAAGVRGSLGGAVGVRGALGSSVGVRGALVGIRGNPPAGVRGALKQVA